MGLLAFPVVMERHLTRKLFLWASGLAGLATIGTLWPHTTIKDRRFPHLWIRLSGQKAGRKKSVMKANRII
jgi:hypothetical protein